MELKQCCYCKEWFPATTEYFNTDNRLSSGLTGRCKKCKKTIGGLPIAKDGYKICSKCEQELPATEAYFHKHSGHTDGYHSECRNCRGVIPRATKEGHRICLTCGRELPLNCFNKQKLGFRGYRSSCKECRAKNRQEKLVRAQRSISNHKRRSMKKQAIACFGFDDWQKCLEYFDRKCAYCGESNELLTKDHVIPVSRGGGFVPSNIVCACQTCNISKGNRDVFKWYRKQSFYDLKREKRIREFINCKNGEPMELALF